MAYWWVSQNKTWSHEVGGGFMWAPKTDERGNTHFGWAFMLDVRPGDLIFPLRELRFRRLGLPTRVLTQPTSLLILVKMVKHGVWKDGALTSNTAI